MSAPASSDSASSGNDSEDIPKLPRAPLFRKLSVPSLVRIGMFGTLLYAVIVMRRPCADGVGRFVGSFDDTADAGPVPASESYPGYELITAEEALERWPDRPQSDAGTDGGASDRGTDELEAEGASADD